MRRGTLLSDMGLLTASFDSDGHLPRHACASAWGDDGHPSRDGLADPDGHGWQIDRVRFEQSLRAEATRRGAHVGNAREVDRDLSPTKKAGGWASSCGDRASSPGAGW